MGKSNHFGKRKYRKKVKVVDVKDFNNYATNGRIELIQQLIPLGLMFISEELQC